MNNMENKLNIVEKALNIVEKYKITTIFKSLLIIVVVAGIFAFISNPTYIFEKYKEWSDDRHIEDIEYRLTNNEKIHLACEKLLLKTNADRVMLLEVHNSGSNLNGLPFVKASCIYESISDSIFPLSDYYQNIQLSLLPFSTMLFKEKYWCGDVDKLIDIDKNLYHKMKSNNAEHFASCVITGVENKPLGFLFVSYQNIPNHNCIAIKNIVKDTSNEIAIYLELNKK